MILDEYVFLKRLGEGAFATVWAARKRVGDDRRKLYAVKHLKQSDDPSSGKNLLTTPEFRSLKAILGARTCSARCRWRASEVRCSSSRSGATPTS